MKKLSPTTKIALVMATRIAVPVAVFTAIVVIANKLDKTPTED